MSEDIFVAKSRPADALVGPLHTITYVTADLDGLHQTLTAGLEQQVGDSLDAAHCRASTDYLGLGECGDWSARCYLGPGDVRNVQIRTIAVTQQQAVVRPSVLGDYLGGLSIGFPMANIAERDQRMADIGVKSTVGLKELEFAGPNGEVYVSGEIHFPAAENVFLLGVQRPGVFVPVGPIDGDIGAAAYSARCTKDADALVAFFTQALGFECRRDMAMTVGDNSGLRQKEGTPERFIQLFAPGANTGYLVLLEHGDAAIPSPAPTQGPPSRGMVMWSFPTSDLDEVISRAQKHGATIRQPAQRRSSPFLPHARTAIVDDPNGFPLEFFQT
jgi:catechol 2,3-dioxygenase-like lactoylglutathione lyase family enzyme